MASFDTQNGDGRTYSADSYNTAAAAGGRRSSPMRPRPQVVGAGLGAIRPGGYVPTYAKYAKPGGAVATAETGAERMRAAAAAPQPFLGGDFDQFQGALSGAAKGYADMAGEDFKKDVGTLLGNLNGIGALRSGGVQAGINDAMTHYGREVGDYTSQLASQAANLAQGQYTYEQEAAERKREYYQNRADAKSAQHKSAIGKILGGIAGGIEAIPGIGTAGKILGGIFG